MKLTSLVVALAAIIVSTSSVMAQPKRGAEQRNCNEMANRRTENLKKAVKLDDSQEKKAAEIYLKYCKESRIARQNNDKTAALKIRENITKEIDDLLTPEQQKLWKAEREKNTAQRKHNGQREKK